jgi:hypothetical protein
MSEVKKLYRVTIGDTTTELDEEAMLALQKQINDAIGVNRTPNKFNPNESIPREFHIPQPPLVPNTPYPPLPQVWCGTDVDICSKSPIDQPEEFRVQPERTH